jgi:tRNA(fMet)-specific endonuclease VapC
VVTGIVVACERRYVAAKRGAKRLIRQVEVVLGAIAVLPIDTGVDRHYA